MKLMKVLARLLPVAPSLVYRLLQLSNHTIKTDEEFLAIWWRLVREDRVILTIREAANLRHYLTEALPLGGAIAELGVYRGGGAKLLGAFKGERPLYLFDTFTGMPSVDQGVDLHHEGDFADTTLEEVREYLSDYPQCFFHPGFFPESTIGLSDDLAFCFVHLDVDLYESTLAGLRYFYPRLQPGGVIISHDYNSISCPGVRKAFTEFFADKCEEVIGLWDTQAMVRKHR